MKLVVRLSIIFALTTVYVSTGLVHPVISALADESGHDSGGHDSNDGGGDDGGDDGGNSGSASSNSGSGSADNGSGSGSNRGGEGESGADSGEKSDDNRSLAKAIRSFKASKKGRFLDATRTRHKGKAYYKITFIRPNGRVSAIYVKARSKPSGRKSHRSPRTRTNFNQERN